jgi:hypothetical protein
MVFMPIVVAQKIPFDKVTDNPHDGRSNEQGQPEIPEAGHYGISNVTTGQVKYTVTQVNNIHLPKDEG